jgi:hypothetical protein
VRPRNEGERSHFGASQLAKSALSGPPSEFPDSLWKGYSAKFVRGVWLVRTRVGMSYTARRPVFPPSWAAGLFVRPFGPARVAMARKLHGRSPEPLRQCATEAGRRNEEGAPARFGSRVRPGARLCVTSAWPHDTGVGRANFAQTEFLEVRSKGSSTPGSPTLTWAGVQRITAAPPPAGAGYRLDQLV